MDTGFHENVRPVTRLRIETPQYAAKSAAGETNQGHSIPVARERATGQVCRVPVA